jgi:hypothetical protein
MAETRTISGLDNNRVMPIRAGTPRAIFEEQAINPLMQYPTASSPQHRLPQQDVGMIRGLPETADSEQHMGRWQELHKFNENDIILSKDFHLKD